MFFSAIQQKSGRSETGRVSITDNPFNKKEKSKRNEEIKKKQGFVQEDNFSSIDNYDTVFAKADNLGSNNAYV